MHGCFTFWGRLRGGDSKLHRRTLRTLSSNVNPRPSSCVHVLEVGTGICLIAETAGKPVGYTGHEVLEFCLPEWVLE